MIICLNQRNGAGCRAENPNNAEHCRQCGMSLRYALEFHDAGMLIGAYRIIDVIGYGGFGAVYKAEYTKNGQHIALKQTFDPRNIHTFQSEFTVLHRLSHNHLPQYYEMFEKYGNGYLVMELIPGRSLLDVLEEEKDQPLAEGQVRSYTIQLCNVLAYLHSQTPPLIHRDIKPANIRLTPEEVVKLVDFGLLKEGVDPTHTSRKGGTLAYAPLEQWGGTNMHISPQSDIYSLGATLYHVLTGQPPLAFVDRLGPGTDPLPSPRNLNPHVLEHVSDALMKALAIYPQDRFADATTFKHAFMGITPPPQPALPPPPRTTATVLPPKVAPTPTPKKPAPSPSPPPTPKLRSAPKAEPTPTPSQKKVTQPSKSKSSPKPSRKKAGITDEVIAALLANGVGVIGVGVIAAALLAMLVVGVFIQKAEQAAQTATAQAIAQETATAQTATAQAIAQETATAQTATAQAIAQETATAQTATAQAIAQETATAQTATAQAIAQETATAQTAAAQAIAQETATAQTATAQAIAQETATAQTATAQAIAQETATAQTATAQAIAQETATAQTAAAQAIAQETATPKRPRHRQ